MSNKQFTAACLGAAGGIGQPLSLLLKLNPLVSKLVLYDVVPLVHGVGADLAHIETPAKVSSFCGPLDDKKKQEAEVRKALKGVDVVVIPAGVPRKPGMSRDDLFTVNAGIVSGLIEACADSCPNAYICIISNPVNSTVPIASEVLKRKGVYNKKKLFGVSTLDVVRSNTFLSDKVAGDLNVTVIGGHSGVTILPLLSKYGFSDGEVEKLTKRIQNAGTEVVEAKQGAGSATLSMAYAGARFAGSLMKALAGEKGVEECAYVDCDVAPGVDFFATKVTLGTNGVEKLAPLSALALSKFEKQQLEDVVVPNLQKAVSKGRDFALKSKL
eukprot:augustus_masked-scaffold_9-processed-gene-9.40-mRNA-1 protein AED:0.02 eAED:0.02 QI:0/-1/0/1/-1/1/1/0/326